MDTSREWDNIASHHPGRLRWEPSLQKSRRKETLPHCESFQSHVSYVAILIEGSLEVKLPTIWTDEKQSREEAERRGRLEERRVEEKE